MRGLQDGADPSNRPAFRFSGQPELTVEANLSAIVVPGGQLSLTGPADRTDKPHLPVRGDLAHIALAGKYFVPHYAVPMPHRLSAAAPLRRAGSDAGEPIRDMAAGEGFDVLDISGGWAWGQAAGDQLVGYLPLSLLEQAA